MGLKTLDDFTESLDYALVGPKDSRVHIVQTRRFPFNTVCHLGRNFGNGVLRGCSGVLVGPRLVLTAAHCLYSLQRGAAPVRIVVGPGRRDRDTFPYGRISATEFYVPKKFLKPPNPRIRKHFDVGLIVLPRRFKQPTRFMSVRAATAAELRALKNANVVKIAGYPGDRPIGTMWSHAERLKHFTPRRLLYTVDTCPGHSGSPVWTQMPGRRELEIIGVHTSGILDERGRSYGCGKGTVLAPPGLMNSGTRILMALERVIRQPTPKNFRRAELVRPPQTG